jgi:hypothetical protein
MLLSCALTALLCWTALVRLTADARPQDPAARPHEDPHAGMVSARHCMACHNGLTTPAGEDVSIGPAWRGSMMAHSARDPYWQAAVRREMLDHPRHRAEIESECSRCHMPMMHVAAQAQGRPPSVFDHLTTPAAPAGTPAALAAEGVSCAVCHQIAPDGLGSRASFNGGFVVGPAARASRPIFGPHEVDAGRARLMRSATGFEPAAAAHVQQSELCATCHTLYTTPLDPGAAPGFEFPEQVPYLEWLQSGFRTTRSCQSCHMPAVDRPTPISSVLGEPREGLSRHGFLGGNFFMLEMLRRYRAELGVDTPPAELAAAAAGTRDFLSTSAATLAVTRLAHAGGRLEAEIVVRNLGGHKLPTGYPSRRAWLHVTVRDRDGRVVFSSGAPEPDGAIAGNDNDRDAARFEPHYREIRDAGEVQIYEAILGTSRRAVTTGLLSAVVYLKDNRLTPQGFDKENVPADVAVHGGALGDPDFLGGEDRVTYSVAIPADAPGPLTLEAALYYQPIAFRWAQNLHGYDAPEPRRFVGYFRSLSASSAHVLARAARATDR